MSIVTWHQVARQYQSPGSDYVGLRPTDLSIMAGERVAIIGPSGSGKSTLLNVLGLMDTPTGGEYVLDGEVTNSDTDRMRTRRRGQHIGFIFQGFQLQPHRTVRENVRLGLLDSTVDVSQWDARIDAALDAVGLGHRANYRAVNLSGGEQQRVAIARAVCRRPKLLLADEPTGNLDSVNSATVLDLLATLMDADSAHVIVTHDPAVAATCDRVIEISDGWANEAH